MDHSDTKSQNYTLTGKQVQDILLQILGFCNMPASSPLKLSQQQIFFKRNLQRLTENTEIQVT